MALNKHFQLLDKPVIMRIVPLDNGVLALGAVPLQEFTRYDKDVLSFVLEKAEHINDCKDVCDIIRASNSIARSTRRGFGNIVFLNPKADDEIKNFPKWKCIEDENIDENIVIVGYMNRNSLFPQAHDGGVAVVDDIVWYDEQSPNFFRVLNMVSEDDDTPNIC